MRSGSLVPETIVASWPAASLSFTRLGRMFMDSLLAGLVGFYYHPATLPLRRRRPMITEVITFKLRPGMTREDVVAVYRTTAPIWRANAECIRKCYLYDGERRLGGGAYLWKTSEDEISIVYFETRVVADNLVQQTIEDVEPVAPASVA